jgi:hypothetical protein
MARFAWLALAAVVASGCGTSDSAGPSSMADCAALLVWNGVTYEGIQVDEPRPLGRRLGTAVVPRCGPEPRREVGIRRIEGVHPSIAVVAPGPSGGYPDSSLVWVGPGYLLSSPVHPLHEDTRAAVGGWDATARYRCETPRTVHARAQATPAALSGYLQVAVDDPILEAFLAREDIDRIVNLDRRTVVKGLTRHGVPYVEVGDEFDLAVRDCVGREDEPGLAGLRRLVATKLTLEPRDMRKLAR